MSETLEARLRLEAEHDPNTLVTVYPGDVVEIIDKYKSEWISVKDRLPAGDSEVWAYGRLPRGTKSFVWTAEFFSNHGWYTPEDREGSCEELIVSHWQPKRIPEPPEAGE